VAADQLPVMVVLVFNLLYQELQLITRVVEVVGFNQAALLEPAVLVVEAPVVLVLMLLTVQQILEVVVEVEVILLVEPVVRASSSSVTQIHMQQQQVLQVLQQSRLQVDIGYTLGLVLVL
jgi:hypothetical protein